MLHIDTNIVLEYINANEDLKKYFNYYINYNVSYDNSYHNLNYTLQMMYIIISISKEENISNLDLYCLLTSALFCNFNNSNGKLNETTDLYNAKLGLNNCLISIKKNSLETQALIKECEKLIESIYIENNIELEYNQKIMRESRILTLLFDDFITHTLFGIKTEIKIKENADLIKYILDYIIKQFNSLELEFSKKLVNEHKDSLFTLINDLCNILK